MEHYTDLAFRYIKMKKSRSILTVIGVSVSVMLLYVILNLGWSYILNYRAEIRAEKDYEIILLTENEEQINAIIKDKHVKDATVGDYYVYDYDEPVNYPNATYINTKNPYRMNKTFKELTQEYSVSGKLNKDLASTYLQGDEGEVYYVLILVYFLIAYIFAIFGVGIIRNSIQLTLFEQVKDFGNLRCIGSTRRQMEGVIFLQGLVIEAAGIVCGTIMGWCGSMIGGYMLHWENTGFHFLPIIFIVVAFMYDLFFAMKENAKMVTGMSPVSAIRGEYRVNIKDRRGLKRKRKAEDKTITKKKVVEKKDNKKSPGKSKRLFGIEGEYAIKNLMRSPGRFFKVVTAMTFGVAATIILSCGALVVMRYDSKMNDMYGYYPVFVTWYMEPWFNWSDIAVMVPFNKLNNEIKELSSVKEAKRVLMDGMYVNDYEKDINSYYTDTYIEKSRIEEFQENIINTINERIKKGEDSTFYEMAMMNFSVINVVGYDKQQLQRCKKDLKEGTLDVSEKGVIVVENGYLYTYDHEEEYDGGNLSFEKLYDYKLGDAIELLDMKEFRKRLNEMTAGETAEYNEKSKDLNDRKMRAGLDHDNETFDKLDDEICELDIEYNRFYAKCKTEVYNSLKSEGAYKTYTVEGILKHNPNGYRVAYDPLVIVPADRFHEVVGREDDYFAGMMYHFEPFRLNQYDQVDWQGIEQETVTPYGTETTSEYAGLQMSDYANWVSIKIDLRNGIIAAALTILFLISMVIINYINNTSSNIYMRRKEFAQLRVIGVSKKGLFKMVMLEGLIAAIVSCILGLVFGTVISYGLISWIFIHFKDVEFVFPWIPAILSVIISVIILCGAVYIPLKKMGNDVASDLATAGE